MWRFLCFSLIGLNGLPAGAAGDPLTHTYSIVARDPKTGALGVAVQSHWFQVGNIVPWAEAGVGAIATQALSNASYGPRGLALLKKGYSPSEVIAALIASDPQRENRQLIVVDAKGRVAAHTGKRCIAAKGHYVGKNFAVAANLMRSKKIWPAMARAFRASRRSPFAEQLLAALRAAQAAGGDVRGRQSAALLVVAARSTRRPWIDRQIDIRVADHRRPLSELGRLLRLKRAYQAFGAGESAMAKKQFALAEQHYGLAKRLAPQLVELSFWQALSLFKAGKKHQAARIFRRVFIRYPAFRTTLTRLPSGGLLKPHEVREILARCRGKGHGRGPVTMSPTSPTKVAP